MKDIRNYEGLYAITEDGRIFSYKSNKFLKARKTKRGYLSVCLYSKNIGKDFFIHRLVAMAYLDNPNNYPEVNHKDEDKTNNHRSNLEWCTRDYNMHYGVHLTSGKTVYCVELNRTFKSVSRAAQELNLGRSNITHCLRGYSKTAGGYHWQYI